MEHCRPCTEDTWNTGLGCGNTVTDMEGTQNGHPVLGTRALCWTMGSLWGKLNMPTPWGTLCWDRETLHWGHWGLSVSPPMALPRPRGFRGVGGVGGVPGGDVMAAPLGDAVRRL